MGRVADILRAKGSHIHSIRSDVSVYEAVQAMVSHNVGSLLVLDNDEVKGIVTERDYLREIVLRGRTSKTTLVAEIMTTEVVAVEPSRAIEECMAIMTERRIRHLPVVDQEPDRAHFDRDLVKRIASDRESRFDISRTTSPGSIRPSGRAPNGESIEALRKEPHETPSLARRIGDPPRHRPRFVGSSPIASHARRERDARRHRRRRHRQIRR